MRTIERLLGAVGAGLLGVTLLAGVIQSLRVEQRLPAVDLFGNGGRAYINRLVTDKNLDGAIEQLEMQARMLPLDADTYEQLGNLLAIQGRPKEAREKFLELARLRPDYAQGYNLLGSTFLDTNQPDSAAECFAQAIRLDPRSGGAFNGMGVVLAGHGKMTDAERCFAKAVELAPDDEGARINLRRAQAQRRGN